MPPWRLKQARFPVTKSSRTSTCTPPRFHGQRSTTWRRSSGSMPRRTRVWWDAGTGKSHVLIGLGHAAVEAGKRVRYFTAAELVETAVPGTRRQLRRQGHRADPPGRGRHRRRAWLRLRSTMPGRNCCSGSSQGPTSASRSASAATGHLTSGGDFLPEHTTAVSMLDRLLHHGVVVVTDGESFRMREARQRSAGAKSPRGAPPTKTDHEGGETEHLSVAPVARSACPNRGDRLAGTDDLTNRNRDRQDEASRGVGTSVGHQWVPQIGR